jgi:ribosome-binding protein aMBF1 (putative translation factor)
MTLRCDMCHKPLKEKRYQIKTLLGSMTLTVGPDCYSAEKKARAQMLARHTPEEIEALRAKVAAHHGERT